MTAHTERVVVLGAYPPSPDPSADAVLATVRELRTAGATVVVVSPEPSAAPEHGDPRRWLGAVRVARAIQGADRVVWFGPNPSAGHHPPVPWPLRRALARVPTVEHRATPAPATTPAPDRSAGGVVDRLALARAGLPTFVRSIRSRAARARSARRS